MATRRAPSFDQYHMFKPDSQWEIPSELPDLSRETEIAIDTETYDKGMHENIGPGFFKCDKTNHNTGFLCGISLAWRNQSIYVPLRHARKNYFDRDLVGRWLKSIASQSRTRFVFHSFQYDWGWIQAILDIPPPALIDDISAMASMINENLPSFSLDNLCQWQGLPGKDEKLLKQIAALFKVREDEIKKYLFEFDPQYVGPYAEQDASSTLGLAQKLRPLLTAEGLETAYQVEQDLMPITLKMKQRGIRVDTLRAETLADNIQKSCDDLLYKLSESLGQKVSIKSVRSNRWLRDTFDEHGLMYPRTAPSESYSEGQASFEKGFMANHQHWLPRMVYKIRHQNDLAEKFLRNFILGYAHNGRVHPTINQFRNEGGGARSHRFSYSDPALQQTPSRDDEWAPLIRSCFIPEEGEQWCSIDYRQQEYRLIVFVAEVVRAYGAKKAADRYRNDPDTDFHAYVSQITRLPRPRAKDTNFAKAYGAGIKKFAAMTGLDEEEAKEVYHQYDEELPFVSIASDKYARWAKELGYIKLIDGARNHFNQWEPMYRDYAREWEYKQRNKNIDTSPCSEEEAQRRKNDPNHPWAGERMKRAYTHKAFNRMIQGSAARQIKKAMVDIYKAGILPLLQVHDELGFSFSNVADAHKCAKIMEEAVPLITIPMLTDVKLGSSWGELKK
jgi:DNA polymerase I-like protein with 3'-5' exonuclease and polymerase domains